MKYRKIILGLGIPVILAAGGTMYAIRPQATPQVKHNQISEQVQAPQQDGTKPVQPTEDSQPQPTKVVTKTTLLPTEQATSPQTQETTPESTQPDYGKNPNNPGEYVVFNKTKVMTEAGIPADQQASADTLITDLMQWRYKLDGMDADLCYIMPLEKMATVAPDYETNPVTQLKYCNKIAQNWYGGWNQALARYEAHPTYGIF